MTRVCHLSFEEIWFITVTPVTNIQQPERWDMRTVSIELVVCCVYERLTSSLSRVLFSSHSLRSDECVCTHRTSSRASTSSSLAMSPGHSPSCTVKRLTLSSRTRARSTHCRTRSRSMLALLTTIATLHHITHTKTCNNRSYLWITVDWSKWRPVNTSFLWVQAADQLR